VGELRAELAKARLEAKAAALVAPAAAKAAAEEKAAALAAVGAERDAAAAAEVCNICF
jgi:hypothetical protein